METYDDLFLNFREIIKKMETKGELFPKIL